MHLPVRAPFLAAEFDNLFRLLTFPTSLFQFRLHAWTVQYFAGLAVAHIRDALLPLNFHTRV